MENHIQFNQAGGEETDDKSADSDKLQARSSVARARRVQHQGQIHGERRQRQVIAYDGREIEKRLRRIIGVYGGRQRQGRRACRQGTTVLLYIQPGQKPVVEPSQTQEPEDEQPGQEHAGRVRA